MSKAYAWRDAIEKAKNLEQHFELSDETHITLESPGLKIVVQGHVHHIEVDDAELVKLGSWLYETFYEEPADGQEP